MAKWTKFPYADDAYVYTAASLKKAWGDLHKGDAEPFPKDKAAVEAWIAFHAGEFQTAFEAGFDVGGSEGLNVANKAMCIYANYLEKKDKTKIELFEQVAARCEELQEHDPKNANAFYWHAYALGRYAQGISIVKALSQGIGGKVKASLETTIKLAPKHADAHIGLGAYHAEIIDKVGSLVGGMTYGAKKDIGLKMYETAIKLNPDSAIARIEYANGLMMLEGKKAMSKAEELYGEAAEVEPRDAMERLDVELAKSELE